MSIEIFDNSLIKLLVRQGTDNERKNVILNPGEPGYTTDTRRLFIGDGATRGGVLAGNVFKGSGSSVTSFAPAEVGDLAYSTTDKILYRLKLNDGSRISDWEEIAKNSTTTSGVSGLSGDYVLKSGDTITANTSRAGLLIKQLGAGSALEVEDPLSTDTRFAVTNQGLVGVGTSNPTAALDVISLSSNNLARFVGSGNQARGVALQNNFASLSTEASAFFTVNNESGHAVSNIQTIVRTDGASEMVFQTQGSGSRTDRRTERLRIDETGNIGVGVSNPTTKLDVSGTIKGTTLQGNLSGQSINLTGDVTGSGTFNNSSSLNITTALGNSPVVARAWVVFNGLLNSGGTGFNSISASYNVSSVIDLTGAGNYRIIYTNPLPEHYVVAGTALDDDNDGGNVFIGRGVNSLTTINPTSGVDIRTWSSGNVASSSRYVTVACIGGY